MDPPFLELVPSLKVMSSCDFDSDENDEVLQLLFNVKGHDVGEVDTLGVRLLSKANNWLSEPSPTCAIPSSSSVTYFVSITNTSLLFLNCRLP